jgi:hypothetical protein
MAKQHLPDHEIRIKVADRQLAFLENRANELGLSSKAELLMWYITNDMARFTYVESEQSKLKKERVHLEGIVSDGRVAEADIEEVEKEWEIPESL